jgi:hypothetical protein
MEETCSTLRFGTRAKMIKNKATINQEKSVAEYKILLHNATVKIGIQTSIIDLLEKDVANLLESLQAVAPSMAIPSLLSRDSSVIERMQQSKNIDIEDGGSAAAVLVAEATDAAALAAAGVSGSVAIGSSATSSARASPNNPPPASNTSSPATSPDVTPDSSPKLQPIAPPVVKLGLPSLASLNTTTTPTTVTVSLPSVSSMKSLTSPTHSLSELMLTNSDLAAQIATERQARRSLEHNLEDVRKDTQELTESFNAEKIKFAGLVEDEKKLRLSAEERALKSDEIVNEFNLLKKKLDYMKKEHALELSQADAQKTELSEEVTRLQSKVGSLESKMMAQAKAYEAVMERVATEKATATNESMAIAASIKPPTTASSSSVPNSPAGDDEETRKKARSRLSAPPESTSSSSARQNADGSHPLLPRPSTIAENESIPEFGNSWSTEPNFTPEEQSQIDQLNRGLKRKCDQYIQLMMAHQAQAERVESVRE